MLDVVDSSIARTHMIYIHITSHTRHMTENIRCARDGWCDIQNAMMIFEHRMRVSFECVYNSFMVLVRVRRTEFSSSYRMINAFMAQRIVYSNKDARSTNRETRIQLVVVYI